MKMLKNRTGWGGSCAAPFLEQFLSLSTSKTKKIYYKDTKEKDQMIFSHMACFCHTGGFWVFVTYNINGGT